MYEKIDTNVRLLKFKTIDGLYGIADDPPENGFYKEVVVSKKSAGLYQHANDVSVSIVEEVKNFKYYFISPDEFTWAKFCVIPRPCAKIFDFITHCLIEPRSEPHSSGNKFCSSFFIRNRNRRFVVVSQYGGMDI